MWGKILSSSCFLFCIQTQLSDLPISYFTSWRFFVLFLFCIHWWFLSLSLSLSLGFCVYHFGHFISYLVCTELFFYDYLCYARAACGKMKSLGFIRLNYLDFSSIFLFSDSHFLYFVDLFSGFPEIRLLILRRVKVQKKSSMTNVKLTNYRLLL